MGGLELARCREPVPGFKPESLGREMGAGKEGVFAASGPTPPGRKHQLTATHLREEGAA